MSIGSTHSSTVEVSGAMARPPRVNPPGKEIGVPVTPGVESIPFRAVVDSSMSARGGPGSGP